MIKYTFLFSLLIALFTFSCRDEEDYITDAATANFFPSIADSLYEGSGPERVKIVLEISKILGKSGGSVVLDVSNAGYLNLEPAPDENDHITFNFSGNKTKDSVYVRVNNDEISTDYISQFRIVDVTGGIEGIGPQNTFYLYVMNEDMVFEEDFEAGLGNWTTYTHSLSNSWKMDDFNENNFAVASNYDSDSLTNTWLISSSFNFDNYFGEYLTFQTTTGYNTSNNLLEVYVIQDYNGGDPDDATKIKLNPALDPKRGSGYGTFTDSGVLDLSNIEGEGYIAFHFVAVDAQDGAQWQVDNVKLSGVLIKEDNSIYSEEFDNCDALNSFTAYSVSGDETWECIDEGQSGGGVRASGYANGVNNINEDWLISPSISLEGLTTPYFSIDVDKRFKGSDIQFLVSTDYDGSSAPSSANWTEVQGTLDTNIDAYNWVSTGSISLSQFAGSQVYIAIKYTSTASAAAMWSLDNFVVTRN